MKATIHYHLRDHLGKGLALLTYLCLALALPSCHKPQPKPPENQLVRTTLVGSADEAGISGEHSYLALVRFDDETDLGFKVGGIVTEIGPTSESEWDEGTPVKAGTVLAMLKQADFLNALNSARARVDLAETTVQRLRNLRVNRAIAQQDLDVAEAESRTAQAFLDQAEQNLKDSRLLAKKDGTVLRRYVNANATVLPSQRVLRVADTSIVSIELGLPDRLIGRLKPGKELPVEVSALEGDRPFIGVVSEVGIEASSEGRLFRVVVQVPNPDGRLRSGMTARIRFDAAPQIPPGTVTIPLSALVAHPVEETSGDGSQTPLGVFVVENGKALRREVNTGDILKSSILVTSGLRVGERVVTSGAGQLHDGALVKITEESSSSK